MLSLLYAPCVFYLFYFLRTSSVGGGGGSALPEFMFLCYFSCSADHERDWPPYEVVFSGWQPIQPQQSPDMNLDGGWFHHAMYKT